MLATCVSFLFLSILEKYNRLRQKNHVKVQLWLIFFLLAGARVNFWGQTPRAKYTSKLQLLCTSLPILRSHKPNLTCWLNQVYSCFALLEWSRAAGAYQWIRVIFFSLLGPVSLWVLHGISQGRGSQFLAVHSQVDARLAFRAKATVFFCLCVCFYVLLPLVCHGDIAV